VGSFASAARKGSPEQSERALALVRPLALDPGQRRKIAERYSAGETMAALASEYGVVWRALQ